MKEKRFIRLKGKWLWDGAHAIQIVEQTHREDEFGYDGTDEFLATNGLRLKSVYNIGVICNMLFCRGNNVGDDEEIAIIDSDLLEQLKVAVAEYNSFTDADEPKPEGVFFIQ